MSGVVWLLPAELLGYLTVILPLVLVGARLLEQWPIAAVGLKVVAAAWVLTLAVMLWGKDNGAGSLAKVTSARVFATIMLNFKALVFSLVLLRTPQVPQFISRLTLFCLMVVAVALAWGAAGATAVERRLFQLASATGSAPCIRLARCGALHADRGHHQDLGSVPMNL